MPGDGTPSPTVYPGPCGPEASGAAHAAGLPVSTASAGLPAAGVASAGFPAGVPSAGSPAADVASAGAAVSSLVSDTRGAGSCGCADVSASPGDTGSTASRGSGVTSSDMPLTPSMYSVPSC
ncbi:hypothetical protein GCM10020256_19570 [Streptomyces thermocoprophilus]